MKSSSNNLSIVIITKNEEENIERCLKSAEWADEIVVLDSGSTDRTPQICRQYDCRFIEHEWHGFGRTKKYAVEQTCNNWILSVDADEEISQDLKETILQIIKNPKYNGYRINRRTFYLGKLINHCGWNRDYPLRLFNKQYGNFNTEIVHESVEIEGEAGLIEEKLWHYNYPTIDSHIKKINRYSAMSARKKYEQGENVTIIGSFLKGAAKFFKMYLFQAGFLDGKKGLILSINSAIGVYLKYIKLWKLTKSNNIYGKE